MGSKRPVPIEHGAGAIITHVYGLAGQTLIWVVLQRSQHSFPAFMELILQSERLNKSTKSVIRVSKREKWCHIQERISQLGNISQMKWDLGNNNGNEYFYE